MLLKRNKILFNIHLILSFVFCVPLFVLSITGVFIQYENEIKQILSVKQTPQVKPKASFSEILANIKNIDEQFRPMSIKIQDGHKHYILGVSQPFRKAYNVDIYDASVSRDFYSVFAHSMLMLHRNLGLSFSANDVARATGKHIIALASIFLAIIIITGIWLYFPLIKRNFIKSLKVDFKRKGYGFLYQLHSAFGLWCALFLLIMGLSGLFWSYDFVRNTMLDMFNIQTTSHKKHSRSDINAAHIDMIVKNLDIKNATIFASAQHYIVSYDLNKTRHAIHIQNNNLIVSEIKTTVNKNSAAWLKSVMLDIHKGTIFGEIGKAVFAIACFGLSLFIVTGFLMAYKRINKK